MIKRVRETAPLAATLAAALAAASIGASAFAGGMPVPEFGELDADGDGRMSASEWRDSAVAALMDDEVAAAHYGMYDIDGDGTVSGDEYAEVNRLAFERMENEAI